jgi:hypothetical protein
MDKIELEGDNGVFLSDLGITVNSV